jgi:hypothetical protein
MTCRGWQRGLVVSSPPAIEEIGAMGREIESRRGGRLKKNISKIKIGRTRAKSDTSG